MDIELRLTKLVNQSTGSRLFSNKFYGYLEKNGFVAYKNSIYSNMTLVKVVGKYSQIEKNTKLKLRFSLSESVLIFYLIFIFALLFIFLLIMFEPIAAWLKIMPMVMIIMSYIIIIIPFNLVSKDAENKLKSLLEAEI
ncbi:hypothetical protein [Algoriphagus marincola]|uniref:hypothetical protein n=1 Tax=Algoriphagus marincola TaxID=264027 RepID=UPI00047B4B01|nr:hypothetical protein [Algoriphagus marincola]